MKGKTVILLSVAVLAIGLFVLPQTMAMFVGQHTWFSVRTAESQYELCQRCHEAEVQEWMQNDINHGAHSTYAGIEKDGCFCHQINSSRLEAWGLENVDDHGFIQFNKTGDMVDKESWEWRPNTTPHAALTVECIDCHRNAADQLNNPNSAHREFYNQTLGEPEGSNNTACMACHTMIGLNITMERYESGFIISANHTGYTAPTWDVAVELNGTNRTSSSTYWAPGERPE